MFYVFDGVDGAGKSTQLKLFTQWLESQGQSVLVCKDPGSTPLGEEIRNLLLDRHQIPISMRAEMMLFTTARTQLVEELIRPALAQGRTIVLDRYILSTVVYQGHAGQLDPEEIWKINTLATKGLWPDLTFVLDLDPVDALQRLKARSNSPLDRMEMRGLDYFQKVRAGFLKESGRWPDRVETIDANRSVEEIRKEIQEIAMRYQKRKNADPA